MRGEIEAVTLAGPVLRVSVREPLPLEPWMLAVATAIRAFERYAILNQLILTVGQKEIGVSRKEVERLLAPDGFAQLKEWGGWRQVLARIAQQREERAGERPT